MFIISSVYKKPIDVVDAFLKPHRDFLDEYFKKGVFIASGAKVPRDGGVIIAKADSKETLRKIMAEDPFTKHGVSEYEYIEFKPTKTADGYEALFG